jgi:predicted nucleic acid-binding protein
MVEAQEVPEISPDVDDNYILAIATAGKADYLASTDRKHVLILGRLGGTRIVQPGRLLKKLS